MLVTKMPDEFINTSVNCLIAVSEVVEVWFVPTRNRRSLTWLSLACPIAVLRPHGLIQQWAQPTRRRRGHDSYLIVEITTRPCLAISVSVGCVEDIFEY